MRSRLLLALGAILIVIGAYVALRPLLGGAPVTGSRLLDMAFAAFFLLRGVMNVRAAGRRPLGGQPDARASTHRDTSQ